MARWLASRLLAPLACAFALACVSPTLPLPPPSLPSVTVGSDPGTYKLSSVQGAEPNALIIVVNRNTTFPSDKRVSGTFADADGSWEVEVIAVPNDTLDVSQQSGDSRSPTTAVTVH